MKKTISKSMAAKIHYFGLVLGDNGILLGDRCTGEDWDKFFVYHYEIHHENGGFSRSYIEFLENKNDEVLFDYFCEEDEDGTYSKAIFDIDDLESWIHDELLASEFNQKWLMEL